MIVIADTSPINYLLQIELIDLLPAIYSHVTIPPEVLAELQHEVAPEIVRSWTTNLPSWVAVVSNDGPAPWPIDQLDSGERAALALALQLRADAVILDDLKARTIAITLLGLNVSGTLNVLLDAHRLRVVDGRGAFHLLISRTTFRCSKKLEQTFLEKLNEL